jgi:mono/diheme cytochrome c family protein
MKKVLIIGAAVIVTAVACTDVKKEQNRTYMPDMAYSRAYETYMARDSSKFTGDQNDWENNGRVKIFYNNQPVPGTVARNETYVYHIPKDRQGDSVNYLASRNTPNPLPQLDTIQKIEAERLFLINCAICHGPKLDGNGPLYKDGTGPWPGQPAVLNGTVPKYREMPPGQMYYSITYGKNLMGSYASQVNPQQRWAIVHYIKDFQAKGQGAATPPAGGAKAQSQTSATGLDTAKPAGIGNQGQNNGNQQNGSQQNGSQQNNGGQQNSKTQQQNSTNRQNANGH